MRFHTILAILVALFAILTLLDRVQQVEVLAARVVLPALVALLQAGAMVAVGALLRRTWHVDLPLDFLIGYPVFGTLLFLVGLLKVSAWTMLPLLIAGLLGALVLLLKWYGSDERRTRERTHVELRWPALFVFAVLAFGLAAAQRLPSFADEVALHLAIPHTWALEEQVVELPLLAGSYSPLGIESADLLPLTLLGRARGGLASHFLHWLAAVATTILIVRRTQSWLATAAIVTTPALAFAAGWSLIDWPLTGLFVALYVALEDDSRNSASAATAAGLLTSYAFVPFAIAAWVLKKRVPTWTALLGVVFFIRNFGEWPDLFRQRALALADYVFEAPFVEEALGASLLVMPLFASGVIAVAAALLALALFFFTPSARLLVPFLAVATMSAAPALQRRLVSAIVAIAIVVQTFIVFATPREEPAQNATIDWLNLALPRDSRTLIVGLNETYSILRKARGGDAERVSRYLDLPSADAVRDRLRSDGISHVALVEPANGEVQTLTPSAQRMLAQTLDRYAANVTSRGDVTLFTLR
ncbi:MAG TPA: hypothetical protein VE010_06950 [Thermoanaerobaculia bacterium]|nr:hypothetical protein [Thermoanaerobaculia bacterium]